MKNLQGKGARTKYASEKTKKILKKINRIIDENLKTEELTDEELLSIAEKFNLSIKISVNGNYYITSKLDEWHVVDEGCYYILLHNEKTIAHNAKEYNDEHIQDVFYSMEYLMASIVSHDMFKLGIDTISSKEVLPEVKKIFNIK